MAHAMSPAQFATFLAQGFVGQIPVWDESGAHEVGYRTSYDSGDVTLYAGYAATPGAILYSPDFLGKLVTITVGSSSPAGKASGSLTVPGQAGNSLMDMLNRLPGWAWGATAGVAVILLLMNGGGRR